MTESTKSQTGNQSTSATRGGKTRIRNQNLPGWLGNLLPQVRASVSLSVGAMIYFGVIISIVSGVGFGISLIPGIFGVVVLFTLGLILIAAAPTLAGLVTNRVLSAFRII